MRRTLRTERSGPDEQTGRRGSFCGWIGIGRTLVAATMVADALKATLDDDFMERRANPARNSIMGHELAGCFPDCLVPLGVETEAKG